MEEQRLSRIEGKLDRLAEAMVALARVEERMVTLFRWTENSDERLDAVERRIGEIELRGIGHGQFFRAFDKLAWLLIGAAVAVAVKMFGLA